MAVALPAGTLTRGRLRGLSIPKSSPMTMNWAAVSLVVIVTIVAVAVPLISPHDPLVPAGMPLQAPGKGGFLLGTDPIGRDILSRVLFGVRASWFAALVVVAVGLLIGGLVGLIAGAAGGWLDTLLMRITDAFLSLPAPVLAIAVVAALGPGFVHTLIAVSIVWWRSTHVWCAAKWPASPPDRTSRPRGWPASARSGWPPGICCREPCPTRWSPPASISAT
jgi:peptide/nickel transport system permease protein